LPQYKAGGKLESKYKLIKYLSQSGDFINGAGSVEACPILKHLL